MATAPRSRPGVGKFIVHLDDVGDGRRSVIRSPGDGQRQRTHVSLARTLFRFSTPHGFPDGAGRSRTTIGRQRFACPHFMMNTIPRLATL